MKIALLLLALFPFLHSSSYQVEYVSCKANEIFVMHEEEQIEVTLFNIKITKDKGWDNACAIIKDAKELRIEIDPSTKIDRPLSVYLFADDKLVQEELIKKNYAYPMIRNPEYTYEDRLEDAMHTTKVMAQPTDETKKKSYPIVAPIAVACALSVWGAMLWYIIYRYRKKKLK